MDDAWKVRAHGPVEKLADNLWRVTGALPGMSLRRVMTVVRRADGDLVVHSAIALDAPAMAELEAWGRPAFLLVPNGYHRLDAAAYLARYPDLRVYAPSGSRAKVAEVVQVDGAYEDFPHDYDIRLETLRGVGEAEGVAIVRSGDGVSVVLNDVVFDMDRKTDPLGWLLTTLFGSAPGPRVSRLAKWLLVKDRAALRADLERLAGLPGLERVIVAHEKVSHGPAAAVALRKAATFL